MSLQDLSLYCSQPASLDLGVAVGQICHIGGITYKPNDIFQQKNNEMWLQIIFFYLKIKFSIQNTKYAVQP